MYKSVKRQHKRGGAGSATRKRYIFKPTQITLTSSDIKSIIEELGVPNSTEKEKKKCNMIKEKLKKIKLKSTEIKEGDNLKILQEKLRDKASERVWSYYRK